MQRSALPQLNLPTFVQLRLLLCRFLHQPASLPSSTTFKKTWMIASRNPNLRLVGNFAGEVQPGAIGYGFIVSVLPSYVQVAWFRGRYVLRDGYHRYLGEQPPTLIDYLDDQVAASVMLPASQKMIVIHGIEMNPLG